MHESESTKERLVNVRPMTHHWWTRNSIVCLLGLTNTPPYSIVDPLAHSFGWRRPRHVCDRYRKRLPKSPPADLIKNPPPDDVVTKGWVRVADAPDLLGHIARGMMCSSSCIHCTSSNDVGTTRTLSSQQTVSDVGGKHVRLRPACSFDKEIIRRANQDTLHLWAIVH